ncbi:unnamed protein product [Urochloa humidicola]
MLRCLLAVQPSLPSPPPSSLPLPLLRSVAISVGRHSRRQEPNRRLLAKKRRHLCHGKQQGAAATTPAGPAVARTMATALESVASTHCAASLQ